MKKLKVDLITKNCLDELLKEEEKGLKESILENHITLGWSGYKALNKLSLQDLATALFVGYELEKTPEEELLYLYHSFDCMDARKFLVIDILDILKREIKGINA